MLIGMVMCVVFCRDVFLVNEPVKRKNRNAAFLLEHHNKFGFPIIWVVNDCCYERRGRAILVEGLIYDTWSQHRSTLPLLLGDDCKRKAPPKRGVSIIDFYKTPIPRRESRDRCGGR
jgi:hypothetical protein